MPDDLPRPRRAARSRRAATDGRRYPLPLVLAWAAVAGGLGVVLLSVVAALWWSARDDGPAGRAAAVTPSPATASIEPLSPKEAFFPNRDEFRVVVTGMSKEDVLKVVGRPGRTDEPNGLLGEVWYYFELTTDPVSKKRDHVTTLEFRDGRVVNVRFV